LCCVATHRGGDTDNNFSRFNSSRHDVRNLLPDMHPVSDKKDICPPKFGYNFSKVRRKEPELRTSIEDFLQPKDQTHERKIGYNAGHIRTILELDTFGPAHSEAVSEKRRAGRLPMSPNLDRNRSSPEGSQRGGSQRGGSQRGGAQTQSQQGADNSSGFWGGDDLTLGSPGSSSCASRGNTNNKSPNKLRTQVLFGGTWNADLLSATLDDKTQPLVRPTTSGYQQDARGANMDYSKSRSAMLRERQRQREREGARRRDKSRQQQESAEYQQLIDDFEAHLKSIQY
jgi:hypothetical protein